MSYYLGQHIDLSLSTPRDWKHYRAIQELCEFFLEKVNERDDLGMDLLFNNDMFNPAANAAKALLRVHENNHSGSAPLLAILADSDSNQADENNFLVSELNRIPDVKAVLADPRALEAGNGEVLFNGEKITAAYRDFSIGEMAAMEKRNGPLGGLREALKSGMVVNPTGADPVALCSILEAVTGDWRDKLDSETVSRTPWTRIFAERSTTGPEEEKIDDLPAWTLKNYDKIVLRPMRPENGPTFYASMKGANPDNDIQTALKSGDYVVQLLVDEEYAKQEVPWFEDGAFSLQTRNTRFQTLVSDDGLVGFTANSGGIVQPLACVPGGADTKYSEEKLNKIIAALKPKDVTDILGQLNEKSQELGLKTVGNGLDMMLRPRLMNEIQLTAFSVYAFTLRADCLALAKAWCEGELDGVIELPAEEKELAMLAPWDGQVSLTALTGLYVFGNESTRLF